MKYTLILLLFLSNLMIAQTPSIQYQVSMPNPSTHLFHIELVIDNISSSDNTLELKLPVWRPGRYMILDFASGVLDFSAIDGDTKTLQWKKKDKSTWNITTNKSKKIIITYKIFANDFALRTRGLNDEHGFINGAAVFMYAEQYRHLPLTLTVLPYKNWHCTTGLQKVKNKQHNAETFIAPNYDYFIDCPIEIGTQKDFEFIVEGKPHLLSIFGEGNWNADTLISDIATIVKINKKFWGDLPYEQYIFLLHISPTSSGGTEHINSTIMGAKPFAFKNPTTYQNFLNLVSHEFFHTWNVKQFRPLGIHPYNYSKENYLKELWIAEGITTYYASLLLKRSNINSLQHYIENIASSIQGDRERPGNTKQSLSESSFDAWVKFWRTNPHAYNTESDYYDKGADIGMLLDLEIRQQTKNTYSLDDVMKEMYKKFPLTSKGYTVDDFQKICEEFTQSSLNNFFTPYVHGTEPIPYEKFLFYAGLELQPKETSTTPSLGITTQNTGEKIRITRVIAHSPAEQAGLDVGDEIIAFNNFRVQADDLQQRIKESTIGEKIKITIFRNEKLQEKEITLQTFGIPQYRLTKIQNPSPLQISIYEKWLSEQWETEKK